MTCHVWTIGTFNDPLVAGPPMRKMQNAKCKMGGEMILSVGKDTACFWKSKFFREGFEPPRPQKTQREDVIELRKIQKINHR